MLAAGYAHAGLMTAVYEEHGSRTPVEMLIPVAGPWVSLARWELKGRTLFYPRAVRAITGEYAELHDAFFVAVLLAPVGVVEAALLVGNPILQGLGAGFALSSIGAKSERAASGRRQPVPRLAVVPSLTPQSMGLGLSMTSW